MKNIPNKWVQFYEPFFQTPEKAREFVENIEPLCSDNKPHPAKIMMHQTQRLISLADDIPKIRKKNETLPMLFLIVCAEHIAKMFDDYDGEGRSRHYVQKFFEEFLNENEKNKLSSGFSKHDRKLLTQKQAVDLLYSVRCDLVHEGKYWGFHFHDGNMPILGCDPDVIVSIELSDLRRLIVFGCIRAINQYLEKPLPLNRDKIP